MALFKKKKEEIEEEDLDDEDDPEELEEKNIRNQTKKNEPEPSPLSKQEIGELINANIIRLHELYNYYRQMS